MNATGGAPADSGRTLAAAALSVAGIAAAVLLAEPLGALRGTMILVLVLPPLAQALDRLGWAELLAARLSRGGPSRVRLILAYVAWLIVSTLAAIAVIGGLLASAINNLPAAAFGAVWLVGASPARSSPICLGRMSLRC